jgi:2'-5' RNA ligase
MPEFDHLALAAAAAPVGETWRAFIAVELPQQVCEAIARLGDQLPDRLRRIVRWVRAEKVHITLRFLGDLDPGRAVEVARALEFAARASRPAELRLGATGVFPDGRPPRVLWCGFEGDIARLAAVHGALGEELARVGLGPERERFTPHATAGRLDRDARGPEAAELGRAWLTLKPRGAGQPDFQAGPITLFRSHLGPGGSRYERLHACGTYRAEEGQPGP